MSSVRFGKYLPSLPPGLVTSISGTSFSDNLVPSRLMVGVRVGVTSRLLSSGVIGPLGGSGMTEDGGEMETVSERMEGDGRGKKLD
jgi:hypothetical protein